MAEEKQQAIIDLTNPVDASWRDILRENPNDPRFQAGPGVPKEISLGKGTFKAPEGELEPGDFHVPDLPEEWPGQNKE